MAGAVAGAFVLIGAAVVYVVVDALFRSPVPTAAELLLQGRERPVERGYRYVSGMNRPDARYDAVPGAVARERERQAALARKGLAVNGGDRCRE